MKKPRLADARRIISKSNPDAKSLKVSWHMRPNLCQGFREYKFYSGMVRVESDGYRARLMNITSDSEGISVR